MEIEELVAQAQNGNQSAFTFLMQMYSEKTTAVALNIVKDYDLAEEANQQTWVRVWQNISDFKNQCHFSTWVQQIAKNRAVSLLQEKKENFLDIDDVEEEELVTLETPESIYELKELEDELITRMKLVLTDHQYRALYGTAFLNMTREELAEELEITPNALDQVVWRARQVMREDRDAMHDL